MLETSYKPISGWPVLLGVTCIIPFNIYLFMQGQPASISIAVILTVLTPVIAAGFQAVPPNQARVFLLFGNYRGSARDSGFFWVNPFFSKRRISLRIRNFETGSQVQHEVRNQAGQVVTPASRTAPKPSKVNDLDGNPIEIGAVVVWRVVNTAEAMFEVDDYEDFVGVQSEAALRALASRHPYDSDDSQCSLRGNPEEIADELRRDVQDRLEKAGVEVIEARISYLAYAQEIAAAMLQRQQAQAVVSARSRIVEGAVGMVQQALDQLSQQQIVELDDERKAQMVSNLLVVLCSDRHTQPVINTGTLY